MSDLTPSERSMRARLAAHSLHSQRDSTELTAKARSAFLSGFERQVDPSGVLTPQERHRRAESARKAHFTRLALRSAQARRKRAQPVVVADDEEAGFADGEVIDLVGNRCGDDDVLGDGGGDVLGDGGGDALGDGGVLGGTVGHPRIAGGAGPATMVATAAQP